MHRHIDQLLSAYEQRAISRRSLVAALGALVTAPVLEAQTTPPPVAARTLNHVSLRVADVDRSLKFYRDLFGTPLINTLPNGAGFAVGVGTAHIGISKANGGRPEINHFCLGIERFDVDRIAQVLKANGVPPDIRSTPDGKALYVSDPDNLSVQLQDVNYRG